MFLLHDACADNLGAVMRKLIVFMLVITPAVIVVLLYFNRYKLWGQVTGIPDFEQAEFKLLNDKYGIPGNHATMSNLNEDIVGVWVEYPIVSEKYTIELSILKNIKTKKIRMFASIAKKTRAKYNPLDKGNPEVKIEIPADKIETVINNGLTDSQVQALIKRAESVNWKPVGTKMFQKTPDELIEWVE